MSRFLSYLEGTPEPESITKPDLLGELELVHQADRSTTFVFELRDYQHIWCVSWTTSSFVTACIAFVYSNIVLKPVNSKGKLSWQILVFFATLLDSPFLECILI